MNSILDLSRFSQLTKATQSSVNRMSGTVADTVRHSLVATESPDATIHHAVIAACPHPIQTRADQGDHYMVAYVSVPPEWVKRLTPQYAHDWDISFVGPAGIVQKLPPGMMEANQFLGSRIYVGFDWFDLSQAMPRIQQPSYPKIQQKLIDFVKALRYDAS